MLRFFRFHAWYGRPPLDGPSYQACARNAASLGGLSGERVRKELLRTLEAAAAPDALEAMREAGVLDRWLPEYAGAERLRALIAREDEPDGLRRLAAILPTGAEATAIGKRLKLSTQEAMRLDVMLAREPAIDIAGGPRAWRAGLYRLGNGLYIDRLLLAVAAPGDWRAALALAQRWTPPELPVSGGDALKLGLRPGPKVGALLDAVERWWIDGRLHRRSRGLPRRARTIGARGMIRPGLTFALWLAIAVLVLVNDMIGDTFIADRLPAIAIEWYKVLVPLPYVVLMAIIHARRTAGPKWFEARCSRRCSGRRQRCSLEYLYGRHTFEQEPEEFLDRFAFWWGAPYPLLVVVLFVAPLAAGWSTSRR